MFERGKWAVSQFYLLIALNTFDPVVINAKSWMRMLYNGTKLIL